MVRLLGAGLAAAVLMAAACADDLGADGTTQKGNGSVQPAAGIPSNAIAIGDDVYMVPVGPDAEGCVMYRAFSPTKAVAQVIKYRTRDGRYVSDNRETGCPP
jgi:hypothetical protein